MRVAFLTQDLQLSGGVGVVVSHAAQLARHHGFDVTLVLTAERAEPDWRHRDLEHLHVVGLQDARALSFDVAVSTWWETAESLFELRAARYASFVQSLEDRFYGPGDAERLTAALTLDLPVRFVTEARWIARTLERLRGEQPVLYVRNGVAKDVFVAPASVAPRLDGPLRVLVEGSRASAFKGVDEALAACRAAREDVRATLVSPDGTGAGADADAVVGPVSWPDMAGLYAEHDVVLKLSRVEGMFGPPLEGMHLGATCVVTPVTGHDEYVEHGVNGLVVGFDDPAGTARTLDLLARDRTLLHELRCGALATARGWPSWERQGAVMALALRRIAAEPPPPVRAVGAPPRARPPARARALAAPRARRLRRDGDARRGPGPQRVSDGDLAAHAVPAVHRRPALAAREGASSGPVRERTCHDGRVDPPTDEPSGDAMRASDREREATTARLREGAGEGRLTFEELADRVEASAQARTRGELARLTDDLPARAGPPVVAAESAPTRRSSLFGDVRCTGAWTLPAAGRWETLFGDVVLDLRGATVAAPETVIDAGTVFGDVVLLVPEGVEVEVRARTLFGDVRQGRGGRRSSRGVADRPEGRDRVRRRARASRAAARPPAQPLTAQAFAAARSRRATRALRRGAHRTWWARRRALRRARRRRHRRR